MDVLIKQTTLDLVQGDITRQSTQAIVNAANRHLGGGGGVDGAIHRVAGPELVKASRPLALCPPGEAVITPGFRLQAAYVIHTVGPIYQDGQQGEAQVLANAYRNSLKLAAENNIQSIAFPSISTGIYGCPVAQAAKVALQTVIEGLNTLTSFNLVRFVLFSPIDYTIYTNTLRDCLKNLHDNEDKQTP